MTDPIFETFAKLPHMRAELAMSAQRLALQQAEEQRMQSMAEAQIPNIKSQTENHLANAAKLALQTSQMQGNNDAQQRRGRLQGYAQSPMFGQMLQDPDSGMQIRQDLQGVIPQGEFQTTLPQLLEAVKAALSGTREQAVGGSPTASASMFKPYNTPNGAINSYGENLTGPVPYNLNAGQGRYNGDNELMQERAPNPFAAKRSPADQIMTDVARGLSTGMIDPGSPEMKAALGMTNFLGGAQSPMKGPSTINTQSTERLRVKGPNGESGTVPKGTTLPEGWTLQ